MQKIVIINNWLISGGAEKQGLILAKTLQNDYEVTLCIYYPHKIENKFLAEINDSKINLLFLSGNHLKKYITFYSFCKQQKISAIISYLFAGNILNAIIGSLLQIPILIGGVRSSNHPFIKNFIQKILHNKLLTLTISNSFKGKDVCIKFGYEENKLKVIHNCFELKNEPKVEAKNKNIINIITVARFVPDKDYLTSLKAFQYALSKCNKHTIRYTIIGYGELEYEIKNWVAQQNLSEFVTIILNPKNINKYLSESDIYLSTSLAEGLSNSIMEAMSNCLPIIATDVGDNSKLVIEGKNGYITRVKDHKQIGECLIDLVNNNNKRIDFGKNSYYYLKQNFTLDTFKSKYLKLIG